MITLPTSTRRRSAPAFAALAAGLILLKGCGTTPVKALLDDPAQFEGKTVRVAGAVRSPVGVLGYGAYRIDDGTGSIQVVTESGGAPREGAKVGVEGTFRAAFTLGTQTVAVIVEQQRAAP